MSGHQNNRETIADLTRFAALPLAPWDVVDDHGFPFDIVSKNGMIVASVHGCTGCPTDLLADAVAAIPDMIAELRIVRSERDAADLDRAAMLQEIGQLRADLTAAAKLTRETHAALKYAHERLAAYVGLPVEQCTGGEFREIVAALAKAGAQ